MHTSFESDEGSVGLDKYASISAHMGVEQTCKDDLESIGYLLIYFLKGSLPWKELEGKTDKESYSSMIDLKKSVTTEVLTKDIYSIIDLF